MLSCPSSVSSWHPWPPLPFLPQRKQHCLSSGHARHPSSGSEAQQPRWEMGGHVKQARGLLSWSPSSPAEQGHSLWNWRSRGCWGRPHQSEEAQTPNRRPRAAQRTHGRPCSVIQKVLPWGRGRQGRGPHPQPQPVRGGAPHPKTTEPQAGPLFSPLRSLLPPEPFGAGDPADL